MPVKLNVIKNIHQYLIKNNKTISVAESCSGGVLSSLLTHLSGSSKYFILGVTAYSNQAKRDILGIPALTIVKNGAVSRNIACLMSERIRKIAKADFGIGITGIAGPTGATAGKPVGTVFIAVTNKNRTICRKFAFQGNRTSIRKQSSLQALQLLKSFL